MVSESELKQLREINEIESNRRVRRDTPIYQVEVSDLNLIYEKLCYLCDGKGSRNNFYTDYIKTSCETCDGSGRTEEKNNFNSISDLESFLKSHEIMSYKKKGLFATLFNL